MTSKRKSNTSPLSPAQYMFEKQQSGGLLWLKHSDSWVESHSDNTEESVLQLNIGCNAKENNSAESYKADSLLQEEEFQKTEEKKVAKKKPNLRIKQLPLVEPAFRYIFMPSNPNSTSANYVSASQVFEKMDFFHIMEEKNTTSTKYAFICKVLNLVFQHKYEYCSPSLQSVIFSLTLQAVRCIEFYHFYPECLSLCRLLLNIAYDTLDREGKKELTGKQHKLRKEYLEWLADESTVVSQCMINAKMSQKKTKTVTRGPKLTDVAIKKILFYADLDTVFSLGITCKLYVSFLDDELWAAKVKLFSQEKEYNYYHSVHNDIKKKLVYLYHSYNKDNTMRQCHCRHIYWYGSQHPTNQACREGDDILISCSSFLSLLTF